MTAVISQLPVMNVMWKSQKVRGLSTTADRDIYLMKSIEIISVVALNRLEEGRYLTRSHRIALDQAWLENQVKLGIGCAKCDKHTQPSLDHIIPVSILETFGVDVEHEYLPQNYQVLCRPCNIFKGDRLDFTNPKTKRILLDFLDRI